MTPEDKNEVKEYVKNKGLVCPICKGQRCVRHSGSYIFEWQHSSSRDYGVPAVISYVTCSNCHASWYERFIMTSFEGLQDGEE